MSTDEDHEKAIFKVESEAGRFPAQMLLIPKVFDFSFLQHRELLDTTFNSNAELLLALQNTMDFVQSSDLDEVLRSEVVQLIEDEVDVMSYSQTARCSVIAM